MKIVLGGPPHSGKSCLRYGLKEAIKSIPDSPYPYCITACPDGEGSWFQEATQTDPEKAVTLKKRYKKNFTDEEVEKFSIWVRDCHLSLVIIDIGGIPDEKNELICASATHAVLLAGNPKDLDAWRKFCGKLRLKIISEIKSDYTGKSDTKLSLDEDGIYRGSVHYLERGDLSVKERPTIIQLAKIFVDMTGISETTS